MSEQHGGAPRFEKTDVEPRVVVRFGLALTAALILAALFLVGFMRVLDTHAVNGEPAQAPLAMTDPNRKPPEPRLQEQPFGDIDQLRADQRKRLAGSGWVNRDAGVAYIPIDDAMRALAKKGLPTREGRR